MRTVFFDTLNLDLSLFSPCLPAWAEAAGLEFFGQALDSGDLLPYLHLLGDSKFGVINPFTYPASTLFIHLSVSYSVSYWREMKAKSTYPDNHLMYLMISFVTFEVDIPQTFKF